MELWKKIMKRFEWIVFDLDGTIIDSTNELYKIYKLFLKEFGFNGSKTEFNRLNGPKLEEIISILKSKYNIKEKKIDLLNNYNKKIQFGYKNKILPKKNSKKLLEFLARNQYKIGLVTSSSRKNTNLVLKKNKLLKYFSMIVCGDDVLRAKPYPDIYKLFLKKITSDKEKVLVIEDSKNGYESAKNAGLECLMVKNLGSLKKKLSKINDHPYQIISSKNINLKIVPFSEKISVSQKKKIEKIWTNEQKNRKKKLFNSKVLSLKSIRSTSKKISISANFVDYKYIITDRHEPSIGLKLKQIGTSGLILIDDKKDEYTLFAKRSKNNTEYPNYFELVPSGNLDDFSKINSGNLDYKSKLLDELEEEMNIKKNQVKKIFEICVIKDKNNSVYDICCIIKLGTNKNRIMRNLRNTVEYTEPKFVKIKDTPRFIMRNYDKIVPTTLGLLEHYLKKKLK